MQRTVLLTILLFALAKQAHSQESGHLTLLAQTWGLLKYHHSAVTQCTVDWDQVFIDSYGEYLANGANDASVNQAIATVLAAAGANTPSSDTMLAGDLALPDTTGWLQRSELLSSTNRAALTQVLTEFRRRPSCHVDNGPFNRPQFDSDRQFFEQTATDEATRALAVARFWNIINYYFPYKELISAPWNQVLEDAMSEVVPANTQAAYISAMKAFTTRIDDSHAFFRNQAFFDDLGGGFTPFLARLIEGETVVTRSLHSNIQPGDVITRIDGKSTAVRRAELRRFSEGSNPITVERTVHNRMLRGSEGPAMVTIRNESGERELEIQRSSAHIEPLFAPTSPAWSITDLAQCQIGYVAMGELEPDQVPQAMAALNNTDAIVFDLRQFPNATLWTLVNFLYSEPIHIADFAKVRPDHPGVMRLDQEFIGRGTNSPYSGRLFILMNEETQSQAEYTVMGLEQHPGAIKFGSQTAGADGDVSFTFLPGQIEVWFSAAAVFYPDGRSTQRVGIVPDRFVLPTIEGLRAGRDELLDAAMRCENLDADFPPSPTVHLGLQYDPTRDGHGFDVSSVGDQQVVLQYTYREDGSPVWYLGQTEPIDSGRLSLQQASLAEFRFDHTLQTANPTPLSAAVFEQDFHRGPLEPACAIADFSSRQKPALLRWSLDGQSEMTWCTQELQFDTAMTDVGLSGLWWAGAGDSGWGITFSQQDASIVAVVYYYDSVGRATWAIGNGTLVDNAATVPMQKVHGYCPSCEQEPLQFTDIGELNLSLGEQILSVNLSLAPDSNNEFRWQRNTVSLTRFSSHRSLNEVRATPDESRDP